MLKKLFRGAVSAFLAVAIAVTTCTSAMAASSKATYIKDVVISYGSTEDEAKNWLTENGYEVLDHNLNEGADDLISSKRAVYLGYTTTEDPEEAVTDMKLMNMKGGYSVQDYQMLLEEQKTNIRSFLDNFIVAINEYRTNYANGQQRAVVAHEMLNLLYDDDTQQYMGDLLLNKIKEEYSDEEWNALSEDAQSKIGDMTTILMQANANAVLAIQQLIAMATDDGDSTWIERYDSAKTYDEMLNDLMESDGLTINDAENQLAAEYDEDAKTIAGTFEDYKTFLGNYTNAGVSFASSQEEIEAYRASVEEIDYVNWFAAGTQYELLAMMMNDDISLLDLITDDDYDVQGTGRYLLYPMISCLSEGERASLEFLPMYQIVSLGINGDAAVKQGIENLDLSDYEGQQNSIYEGIDRTIFTDEVAMTNEALRLQASSGKNAGDGVWGAVSTSTYILWGVFAFSVAATVASFKLSSFFTRLSQEYEKDLLGMIDNDGNLIRTDSFGRWESDYATRGISRTANWSKAFQYIGIAMTALSVALFAYDLWNTYQEVKAYYNAEFTPIPLHMVDEGVDEYDAKIYTYYNAVTCNREEMNMVEDSNRLLKNYGDLNGDVGRQWVALYTTKDKNAGNPLTELKVQYEDSSLPDETYTALSMFGESSAQNLTNKTSGYTYADGKSGIYLFYKTDANAFAASVFSNNSQVLVSVTAAVVVGAAAFFVGMGVEKKRLKGRAANA